MESTMPTAPRRFQFSLRRMLLVAAIVAILAALWGVLNPPTSYKRWRSMQIRYLEKSDLTPMTPVERKEADEELARLKAEVAAEEKQKRGSSYEY